MHKVMRRHPNSVGIFLQGAHGDVNTGIVHKPAEISTRALECFSDRLAASVEEALRRLTTPLPNVPLRYETATLACAIDPEFTMDFLEGALEEQRAFLAAQADDTTRDAQLVAVYCDGAEGLLAKYGVSGFPKEIMAPLHGIRIGDLALLGAPFEMMQGIRREVCAQTQAHYPALLSLCGGALGYAPDRESAEKAKLYESRLVPLINGLLPYGNIWNELPAALIRLEHNLA